MTAQTVALGTALGILVGVITALNRATWVDKLVTVIVIFGYSFPTFVLGAYLILLFGGAVALVAGAGLGQLGSTG